MPKTCVICGKGPISGIKYKRRGMVKRKGGAGAKIVGKSFRRFFPNLQRIKIAINGTIRRLHVCVRCIKAGKVTKA
jgi:large subunit ribosomal protein L28